LYFFVRHARVESVFVEGPMRLNQVIARIAKQMCGAESAKAFSPCRAGNSILVQLGPGARN